MQYEGVTITKYRHVLQNGAILLGNRLSYLNDIKHITHQFVTMFQCNMRVLQLQSRDKLAKLHTVAR